MRIFKLLDLFTTNGRTKLPVFATKNIRTHTTLIKSMDTGI